MSEKNVDAKLAKVKSKLQGFMSGEGVIFQRWNIEILVALFLGGALSFNALIRVLGVNSRTLSDKLKFLVEGGYVVRLVVGGPPVRVLYELGVRGRRVVGLILPLLE